MLWLKAFHIIAMVAWFSALFYLPRLFVYHCNTTDDSGYQRFCLMERRLYHFIMTPAMVITLLLGIALLFYNPTYYLHAAWMHTKLTLVVGLIGFHHYCGRCLRHFAANNNQKSERFYRILNEVPTLFLIAIVLLVVLRPF